MRDYHLDKSNMDKSNLEKSNLDKSNSQILVSKEIPRSVITSARAPRVERSRMGTSSSDDEHQGLKRSYLDRKKKEERVSKRRMRNVIGAGDLSQIAGTGDADGNGVLCTSDEVDLLGTVEEQHNTST